SSSPAPRRLQIGDAVTVAALGTQGILRSDPEASATVEVEVAGLRVRLPSRELIPASVPRLPQRERLGEGSSSSRPTPSPSGRGASPSPRGSDSFVTYDLAPRPTFAHSPSSGIELDLRG